ncbi:MAG: MFS transporter [Pseudomonadota bacterium]
MAGLLGIFLAALTAGFNGRVGALALADVRGALGLDFDDAAWLSTAYSAGELIAMPFATWFAITLSVRRFELWMLFTGALLAALLPFIHDLHLLLGIRFAQGLASGGLIPVLMMAALKFLPPPIRIYGLSLYAMTATFSPNLSIWLAGYWTDGLYDWRWVYWQVVPLALLSALLLGWGLPKEPIQRARFGQANWFGMACGAIALALFAIALDQGVRLDWFASPLISTSLLIGSALLFIYLLTEWHHPTPFLKLQLLGRRNIAVGCTLFVFLLIVLTSGAMLPSVHLAALQAYRPLQIAPIGLILALPQLVLGFAVAWLLYKKWIDARFVFATGLCFIALACFSAANVGTDWNRDQFIAIQTLQAIGQPMAIMSMLFLITSVVQPMEGPFVAGTINALRALGSLVGVAVIAQLMSVRGSFHAEMLLDHAALVSNSLPLLPEPSELTRIIGQQALVLSIADAYRALGVLALLLIPLVFQFAYIPAPVLRAASLSPAGLTKG